ncbi:hypothetical protein BJ741DRAFT_712211 [Chytriomyces cf. hyalinus JEL632]|nr:hypothetical protein BJ741DRAFT_712211 [Chytriomyces cf. hyalinus JEL632]
MFRKGSSPAVLSSGGGGIASQLKKKGDFRRLVESKKITIGAPIKDTFQHLDHVGVNDVAAKHLQ